MRARASASKALGPEATRAVPFLLRTAGGSSAWPSLLQHRQQLPQGRGITTGSDRHRPAIGRYHLQAGAGRGQGRVGHDL